MRRMLDDHEDTEFQAAEEFRQRIEIDLESLAPSSTANNPTFSAVGRDDRDESSENDNNNNGTANDPSNNSEIAGANSDINGGDFTVESNRRLGAYSSADDSLSPVTNEKNKPITITYSAADLHAIELSPFYRLGGQCEYIIILQILTYLDSRDLCLIGATCRFLHRLHTAPLLWTTLYKYNFVPFYHPFEADQVDGVDTSVTWLPRSPSSHISQASSADIYSKSLYQRRYEEFRTRILSNKKDRLRLEFEVHRIDQVSNIEKFLDFTQVRVLPPLTMCSLFLSLVLYCQKVDGVLNISIWACALPLGISFIYLLLNLIAMKIVFDRQFSVDSILRGLWTNMRGPLVFIYRDVFGEQKYGMVLLLSILSMMALQVGLVVVKLSQYIPDDFRKKLYWGIVFIPIWIFFAGYCILPIALLKVDHPLFFLSLVVLWVPFFILFVCLAVKLDQVNNIAMALIFIPFYVIEGAILVSSFTVLVVGLYRWRRGFIERVDEVIFVFFFIWLALTPIVSFQALISARDEKLKHDHDKGHVITATEAITPLLIFMGIFILVASFLSLAYRTSFQVSFV